MKPEELTKPQFKALSCLAYFCLCKHQARAKEEKERFYNQLAGAQMICAHLGIPDAINWEVRNGNIKGLQNVARFSDKVLYTDNYKFDPY